MLSEVFFDRDAQQVAIDLLGALIRVRHRNGYLTAAIVETEAYYLADKGSHASLGFTEKRKALFMPPGTIYMYYARGGDSFNISCQGEGNAVLIKSGRFVQDDLSSPDALNVMLHNNPVKNSNRLRKPEKLCSGQTLLCQALGLRVKDWDQKQFSHPELFIEKGSCERYIQTARLGIPQGRDEDLPYRFIDLDYVKQSTKDPIATRALVEGRDYWIKNK
jgi:DNA-3-methyladenine glycosylase